MAQSKQITKDKFGIESYMAKILDKGVSTSNLYEFEILASVEMKRFMEANAKKKGNGDLYPCLNNRSEVFVNQKRMIL